MGDLPELTESDVRRWTGEASFGRGQGYFRSGHIFDPRRQGNTLRARCLGSRIRRDNPQSTIAVLPEGPQTVPYVETKREA